MSPSEIELLPKIKGLVPGYSEVWFKHSKYGVTRTEFNGGKSHKIYAEELGGKNFISLNYYVTETLAFLKPCEMPKQKVIAFLNGYTYTKRPSEP